MKTKRIVASFLMLAMLIGMMPSIVFDVHAEEHVWNPNATMTLKYGDTVVEPQEVIETDDTKMKIYRVESIYDYTLTTSADNDYAVMFEVYLSEIIDENGNPDYDYETTITLDNVNITTYNPRADQNAGIHAAMMFSDKKSGDRYETLIVELVGNNTVELLGVENDSAADRWSAVAFEGPNTVIRGDGTLNATCRYSDAVGAVSAVYTENTIGLYDTVTLNATADIKAKVADTLLGDGLYFYNMNFITEADTTVNIKASGSGINHSTETVYATYLDDLDIGGDLYIRAADYGINWPAGRMYVGDNVNMSVAGLSEGLAANVGILIRRDVSIGENCNITVDALGAAYSCQVTTTANPSAPITVGKNSVVKMSGSVTSTDFVVDCGTKLSGKNNVVSGTGQEWYGETYRVSAITLEENAKFTINGGYRALQTSIIALYNGSELNIATTDVVDSDDIYEYGPVYLATGTSYIYSGSAFIVETPAADAVFGYTSLNIESDNVYIKAAESAMEKSFTRGTGITTFESDDGVNWTPFASTTKKAYFTTREPAAHICAASVAANTYSNKAWTPIEGEDKHTAKCIYCSEDIVSECQWDRGAWTYSSGNYTLKFECEICEQERISDVEYHSHVYETWTPLTGDNYPKHESTCTVPGCGASTEDYCSNSYGPEYHISLNVMRKDCTKCGQFTVWEFDSSDISTIHHEAKPASCAGLGNVEFWYCEHCSCYYADEECTSVLDPSEAFIQPADHNYGADGICTACGHKNRTLSFVPEEGFPDEYDYYYVILGKTSDGKYYALGNKTADGKREAVLIPDDMIAADGTITLTDEMAEFFYREIVGTSNIAWMADGGCFTFTVKDGFFIYDKDHYGDGSVSYPGYFYPGWDEVGLGEMYAYDKDRDERVWLYFDEENLCFDVCETEMLNIYLYIQLCEHSGLYHNEAVDPTCTEQGTREYYGCGKCGTYYADASATIPYEFPDYVDPFNPSDINDYFNVPALRHTYDAQGVCENCGMLRPVYRPVTTLSQFDQLSENAYYIIVFKDGDKTYAAFLPDIGHINDPLMIDANSNGVVDLMEPDVNANGIPDCIENYIDEYWGSVDYDEDGIKSVEEYNEAIGWMDEDEDVDADDYKLFFEERMYWDLYYEYDNEIYNSPNVVEVTVAPDGSITIIDEGAMEFQMMPSGIWGGQEYDDSELEYENIKDTERLRAAWVPNWWIANYGTMGEYSEGHFLTQNRWYGDRCMPGVIDNKNWKISFNEDGTALLVSTWTTFDDSAALQLVKYTDEFGNERITMVGCYDELWQYSDILSNCTVISGAYLYASEPVYNQPPHDCDFGDWVDDENGRTHTRTCQDSECGKTETQMHNWDDGVLVGTPTCTEGAATTYTCDDCGASYTEEVDNLGHDWGEWMDAGDNAVADIHKRSCKRDGCGAEETGNHEWSEWISTGKTSHTKTCSVCSAVRTLDHAWDSGVETKPATVTENGEMKYTCADCGSTRIEVILKIVCDHSWGRWTSDNDETHIRYCENGNGCTAYQQQDHKWDDGVVTAEPTETTEGVKTYTCSFCMRQKTEAIPMLEHTHEMGAWREDTTSNTHTRRCTGADCTYSETEEHICREWSDNKEGTHSGKCSVCGAEITDEHIWGDWEVQNDGSLMRKCETCGATEELPMQQAIDDAVINTTVAENNGANAQLVLDGAAALFNDVLTSEEQLAVAEGTTTVSIYLDVEDIPVEQVSSSDKIAAEEAIGDENAEIGMYLDINLFKEVTTIDSENSKTEIVETQVTQTQNKVTITIQIPDELINKDDSVNRKYRIIRVHEDEYGNLITDVIEGVFDPATKTFTFETDKFSTYALAYRDTTGVSIFGEITSYNPANAVTIELKQGGVVKYTVTIPAAVGKDAVTQQFEFMGVAAGTYDLVVTKSEHLPYTITGITVSSDDVDLRNHANEAIANICLVSGDINNDGCVDLRDLTMLTSSNTYGKSLEDAETKSADVNGDECFDLKDLVIIASEKNYGKTPVTAEY